jgi:O-antigen/teichoic acid export membrane protein
MFDKLKQLTKDTAIYGVSTMISRFLNFLLVPLYTNIFLPDEYGVITNVYAFIGILNIVFVYGMDASYLKFASSLEIGDKKDNFSTPYNFVFLGSLALSFLILIFRHPVLKVLAVPEEFTYLIYFVVLILFLDSIAVIPFIKLRLERRPRKFALFKTLNISINVLLNLFFILILRWGIEAVFVSNLIASFATLILLIPDIIKNLKPGFHTTLLKSLLKFGLPYLPAGLASMLIQVVDRPIMEHLTDLNTLGIYQANHKLGIFMMLFVNMFQFAWQPFFLQEAKNEEEAKKIFAKVLTYFTLAGSVILIFLSLFIGNFVKWEIFGRTIIGSLYWSGLYIVPVILLAYLFNGLYVVFTAGIYIKKKSIYVPIITGAAAIINIGVNFILIPKIGIMGAAIAHLVSYFTMALGLYIVTQQFYKINYEYVKIAKIFFSVFITLTIYYLLLYDQQLVYKFLLLILFLVLITFLVLDKKELNYINKKLLRRRSNNTV